MSTSVALTVAVILLIANAFFVGAEFAVLSARRSSVEPLAEAGNRRAIKAIWAMERLSLMLACAQLGVTVCSVGLGVIAEPAIAHAIDPMLAAIGVPESWTHPIAFVVALLIVVYLHVVLGEMIPKNLSVTMPDRAVLLLAPTLVVVSKVFGPIVIAMNWLANHILRLTGVTPRDEVSSTFTANEVRSIVARSQAEGVLLDDEGLLSGAIEFSTKTAHEVMVRADDLVTLPVGCTPDDLEEALRRTGYSRFVVTGSDGQWVGYLHIKDILDANSLTADQPIEINRIRALADVSADTEIDDVLLLMQHSGAHLARVQQDGTGVGVMFLEDILEELVGEVHDDMQRRNQTK
ncbi:Hemolysin, contains CBS domains [Micrococcales bacterium KH10]|nr:Hemolysin, contains CBS domains [Micrococcales bacterium KH10]